MLARIMRNKPRGCVFLLFELTTLIANIATIIEWIERLLHPIPNNGQNFPFPDLDYSPFLSGIILIYGLTGISLLIWSYLAERIIGDIQAGFYAFVLYMFSSSLLIYAYANTYFGVNFIDFLFSKTTIFLFIFLPFLAGRVGLEIYLAPHRNSHT